MHDLAKLRMADITWMLCIMPYGMIVDLLRIGDQRDEADRFTQRDYGLTVAHADELQLLRVRGADGDNHAPAFAELREQSGRHLVSGGGDNNGVKWRYGRKTERSVAGEDADV